MDDQHLFGELLHAAARLGVKVRMEPFETPATLGGGLCVVRGETLVLIDQRAPLLDRLRVLARALVELQSETVYMAPEARKLIEALRDDLESSFLVLHGSATQNAMPAASAGVTPSASFWK